MRKFLTSVLIGMACLLLPSYAEAQQWPSKPIKLIVPWAAGGAGDVIGRLFAEQMSKKLGQQVYVENQASGGGLNGIQAVMRAPPDGYTLMISGLPSHVLTPLMNENAKFDPINDFTHIAYLGGTPTLLCVHASSPIKTYAQLVEFGRSEKAGVHYVSPGLGTTGNVVAEYLGYKERIKMALIPYKGGGQAIVDLISGHVKIGSMTWSTTREHVLAGSLRPIAITSDERLSEIPNVPTLKELGHPDLVTVTWFSVSGPRSLPDDVVSRLNTALVSAFEEPEIKGFFARDGIKVKRMTSGEFTSFMQQEVAMWTTAIKRAAVR
jgi:tripartite-type tricarboxylate transporter receptor subunit TctC